MAGDPLERDADLLADAVQELAQLPRSPAVEAALRYLEAAPRVGGVLRRRRALALADELRASGGFWTWREVDAAVGRRLGVAEATVRGWRWARDVFGEGAGQQVAVQGERKEDPS